MKFKTSCHSPNCVAIIGDLVLVKSGGYREHK